MQLKHYSYDEDRLLTNIPVSYVVHRLITSLKFYASSNNNNRTAVCLWCIFWASNNQINSDSYNSFNKSTTNFAFRRTALRGATAFVLTAFHILLCVNPYDRLLPYGTSRGDELGEISASLSLPKYWDT